MCFCSCWFRFVVIIHFCAIASHVISIVAVMISLYKCISFSMYFGCVVHVISVLALVCKGSCVSLNIVVLYESSYIAVVFLSL